MRRNLVCTAIGALAAAILAASSQASWAQNDPSQQWFVCYGPQAQGRLPAPKTMYMSEVSTAIRVTGQTTLLITEAFHAFALQKYGADFAPRCDAFSTEDQARRVVKSFATFSGRTPVQTGWVWTQPESDKAPRPAPTPNPGALDH